MASGISSAEARTWSLEEIKPPLGVNADFPWRNHASLIGGGAPGHEEVTGTCRSIVMRFGKDAGAMGAYHIHHHCDNLYYLLSGTMTSIIGGVRFTTKAGEAIFMPKNVAHATGNFGDEEVYLWEIYVPSTAKVNADGTNDSHPQQLPDTIVDSKTNQENGVRIWDMKALSPEFDPKKNDGWRNSRIIAGGGNPSVSDQVSDKAEIVIQRFKAGANRFGVYHVHDQSDNIWVVLEGTLSSIIGGKRYETKAGDVIFMPKGVPHATGNFTDGEMRALEVYTPSTWITGAHDSRPVDLPSDIQPA
jgi:mannose-6-phosphate isomerase-like protein (cupin superfamily)